MGTAMGPVARGLGGGWWGGGNGVPTIVIPNATINTTHAPTTTVPTTTQTRRTSPTRNKSVTPTVRTHDDDRGGGGGGGGQAAVVVIIVVAVNRDGGGGGSGDGNGGSGGAQRGGGGVDGGRNSIQSEVALVVINVRASVGLDTAVSGRVLGRTARNSGQADKHRVETWVGGGRASPTVHPSVRKVTVHLNNVVADRGVINAPDSDRELASTEMRIRGEDTSVRGRDGRLPARVASLTFRGGPLWPRDGQASLHERFEALRLNFLLLKSIGIQAATAKRIKAAARRHGAVAARSNRWRDGTMHTNIQRFRGRGGVSRRRSDIGHGFGGGHTGSRARA